MTRPNTHYLDVAMEFRLPAKFEGLLKLVMPVWTPGHYVIADFSRNVLEVKASDAASGAELPTRKESKNAWLVEVGSSKDIRVEYSVYAFRYTCDESYIDHLHAIVNGAGVFLFPDGLDLKPISLRLLPPSEWKKVSTGLEQTSDWEFSAPDYDILVDSPIEVGNQEIRTFAVQGVEHHVSIFGEAPVDRGKFVADLKSIVENTIPVFEDLPYKKYVFIVNFTDTAGGGLEHLNSTVCFAPRMRYTPKEEYDFSMGLFSHEFFHTWNVKRLRPKGLGPFNYNTETYTRSLWIAEGITSYYDDLILRKAGVYPVPEYLDAFSLNVNSMWGLPGRKWQSAEQASFDTWVKFYRADENAPNVTSSYYTQGAVIGWMLDMEIRRATKGERTLDDAMRKLYRDTYLAGRGYTDEEFEAACSEVGGKGVKAIFDSRVRGRSEVDFNRFLGYAGLKVGPKDEGGREKGFLGIRTVSEGGKTVVKTVLAGSPAEAMRLAVADEIIGIDGLRVSSDRLSFYISTREPGSRVTLTTARNGMLLALSGETSKRPTFEFRVRPIKEATDEQKAFFKGWMMEDWAPEIKYQEFTKSPDRVSIYDYI